MTRARLGVAVMALLLALYLVVVALYAVRLVGDPLPVVQAMGWALIVLPLIGGWALIAEIRFGFAAERLAGLLEAEGGLPDDTLPATATGRLDREHADELFLRYRAEVEADEKPWQNWFRLALAYDAARDRRRARWATREAIRRERDSRR